MKKLLIPTLVVAAALAASLAPAQGVTVNGKKPAVTKAVKVKQPKGVKTVGPKKHRKKFLGIF